jgi:hypothetical protein
LPFPFQSTAHFARLSIAVVGPSSFLARPRFEEARFLEAFFFEALFLDAFFFEAFFFEVFFFDAFFRVAISLSLLRRPGTLHTCNDRPLSLFLQRG